MLLCLSAVLLFASASAAHAATNVTLTIDKMNVSVGERVSVTIEVASDEETIGEPRFPDIDAFDVYSSGRTQNIQWVNGKMSVSISYNYLMSARDEGEYVIGPATVKVGDKDYQTGFYKIRVSPARTRPQTPQPSAPPASMPSVKPTGERRIFITSELDRDTAYVNQPVT